MHLPIYANSSCMRKMWMISQKLQCHFNYHSYCHLHNWPCDFDIFMGSCWTLPLVIQVSKFPHVNLFDVKVRSHCFPFEGIFTMLVPRKSYTVNLDNHWKPHFSLGLLLFILFISSSLFLLKMMKSPSQATFEECQFYDYGFDLQQDFCQVLDTYFTVVSWIFNTNVANLLTNETVTENMMLYIMLWFFMVLTSSWRKQSNMERKQN